MAKQIQPLLPESPTSQRLRRPIDSPASKRLRLISRQKKQTKQVIPSVKRFGFVCSQGSANSRLPPLRQIPPKNKRDPGTRSLGCTLFLSHNHLARSRRFIRSLQLSRTAPCSLLGPGSCFMTSKVDRVIKEVLTSGMSDITPRPKVPTRQS